MVFRDYFLNFARYISVIALTFAAFLSTVFAIPADLLERVRMSVADYAAKLGRDLKARRLMFALTFTGPGPAYS